MKCGLSEDINKCPFYDKNSKSCNNKDKCSFQDTGNINNNEYVRKERWYEKYYRRGNK